MIERDSDTIRAVAWSEVFPWLSILRVFRLAIAVRALVLGAVGILMTATGWGVIGMMSSAPTRRPRTGCNRSPTVPGRRLPSTVPDQPPLPIVRSDCS